MLIVSCNPIKKKYLKECNLFDALDKNTKKVLSKEIWQIKKKMTDIILKFIPFLCWCAFNLIENVIYSLYFWQKKLNRFFLYI